MASKRGRMGTGRADVERTGDNVTPVTTVVGGQSRRHAHGTTRVPIGIEKVLYLAAANEPFRRRLLEDRPHALVAAKVKLTDVERATLLGVPRPALEAMIARISPEKHGQRKFMKTVAAATISLAAGLASQACVDDDSRVTGGMRPDVPEPDAVTDTEDGDGDGDADVEIPPDATEGIDAGPEPD